MYASLTYSLQSLFAKSSSTVDSVALALLQYDTLQAYVYFCHNENVSICCVALRVGLELNIDLGIKERFALVPPQSSCVFA